MKKFLIHDVINAFFDEFYPSKTVLNIDVQPLAEEHKQDHPNAKFQIEVLVAYSVEQILKREGY